MFSWNDSSTNNVPFRPLLYSSVNMDSVTYVYCSYQPNLVICIHMPFEFSCWSNYKCHRHRILCKLPWIIIWEWYNTRMKIIISPLFILYLLPWQFCSSWPSEHCCIPSQTLSLAIHFLSESQWNPWRLQPTK